MTIHLKYQKSRVLQKVSDVIITSSPARIFAIKGRRKRDPETLHILFILRLLEKTFLDFLGKEISSTINFPIFLKKASPSHNCFSELIIHEGRLVTSNMFFRYMGMSIKYFRENEFKFFKFSRVNILN